MRRLENEDEDKFWEAWIKDDLIFCYRFGKLGSSGHTKIKKFKSRADAQTELEEKLAEKLEEGFVEIGGDEGQESEAEESESEESEESETEADDEAAETEEDDDEPADDEPADDEPADDEPAETEASEEESEEDDDESEPEDSGDEDGDSEEDDDSGDEDDEEAAAEPEAAEEKAPEAPKLPARYRERQPSAGDFERAKSRLEALVKAVGGRSWKVGQKARLAGRALERLGGKSNAEVDAALASALELVIGSKKRLPLVHALRLLAVVDAKLFVKSVRAWRTKMLSVPAAPTIGVLATIADSISDPDLALATALVLADRTLPSDAWQRRFAHVRPVLVLDQPNLGELAKKLRAESDPVLQARVKELSR